MRKEATSLERTCDPRVSNLGSLPVDSRPYAFGGTARPRHAATIGWITGPKTQTHDTIVLIACYAGFMKTRTIFENKFIGKNPKESGGVGKNRNRLLLYQHQPLKVFTLGKGHCHRVIGRAAHAFGNEGVHACVAAG